MQVGQDPVNIPFFVPVESVYFTPYFQPSIGKVVIPPKLHEA